MAAELDSVRSGDDGPMPVSPLSPTMTRPSGLHIHPEPGDDLHNLVYSPGDRSRQLSDPSTLRQGSVFYERNPTHDPHHSNAQTAGATPYINLATRPTIVRPVKVSNNASSPATSAVSFKSPWQSWVRRPSITEPKRNRRYLIICLYFLPMVGLLVGLIVVLVKPKGNGLELALPTSKALSQSSAMPTTGSNIGAVGVVIGTYFSTAIPGSFKQKLSTTMVKGAFAFEQNQEAIGSASNVSKEPTHEQTHPSQCSTGPVVQVFILSLPITSFPVLIICQSTTHGNSRR